MLKIDKGIFIENLRLTQAYCNLQMNNGETDIAKMFRTYNPNINGKPLFSFRGETFDMELAPGLRHCTLTDWQIDPLERGNLIDTLFQEQINFKRQSMLADIEPTYDGDILVSEIDYTVVDGASEVASLGLVDVYDLPPIDTWFYLARNFETRLLFAWIPGKVKHYANEAVLVNCIDCIKWFREHLPKEYQLMMENKQ